MRALRTRSFGVVMHEVVSGKTPERRALPSLRHVLCSLPNFASALASLDSHMLLCGEADTLFWVPLCSVPGECPQGVEDLWRRCTLQDPGARPSASEVLDVLEALAELRRPPQPPAAQALNIGSAGQA